VDPLRAGAPLAKKPREAPWSRQDRAGGSPSHPSAETGTKEMVYTVDEQQLMELLTVVSCLGHVHEIADPISRSEILTRAQIHLDRLRPRFAASAAQSGGLCLTEDV
jgi:hypothetical protein